MDTRHHLNVMPEIYGHRNQATYKVINQITNDSDLFDYFYSMSKYEDHYNLTQNIREYFYELNPTNDNDVYSDLMLLVLDYVDWYQIANYIRNYYDD